MRYGLAAAALGAFGIGAALPGAGLSNCTSPAMLVFDGSASMGEVRYDIKEHTRIQDARRAVAEAMPQITPFRDVGLVIYGPGGADSCSGIEVRFPPAPDTALDIILEVNALRPTGLTPLAASVERAASLLAPLPGTIVLVTDGNETCGGTPCALGDLLAAQAPDLTVHVIGFRVVADFFSWNSPEAEDYSDGTTVAKCLADKTGGLFVSTETVAELVSAMQATLGCALIGRRDEALPLEAG